MKDSARKKIQVFLTVVKFLLLLLILIGVPFLIYISNPDILYNFRSVDAVNSFLNKHQTTGIFLYIGMQIVQVIIVFLPGQALQFAAGYAFKVIVAYLISIIGIAGGTIITFYLGKLLGKDMVYLIFGENRIHRFVHALNSKKGITIIILLYLFPGIPKDLFSYAAGISEVRMLPFLVISLLARTPALMASILVGNMLRSESYIAMIIVIAIVIILAVLGVIFRKKFTALIDKLSLIKD